MHVRKVFHAASSVVPSITMEDKSRSVGAMGCSGRSDDGGRALMVSPRQSTTRHVTGRVHPRPGILHGRVSGRVGSTHGRTPGVRSLVGARASSPYQCAGVEGRVQCVPSMGRPLPTRYEVAGFHGQHYRSGACEQTGGGHTPSTCVWRPRDCCVSFSSEVSFSRPGIFRGRGM